VGNAKLAVCEQLEQYAVEVQQLEAFVHAPTLGAVMPLLNQAGLGNSLPVNAGAAQSLIDGVRYGGGGLPEITGILNGLSTLSGSSYAANHVYSPTDGTWASQQIIANGNQIAGTQGATLAAYGDLRAHAAALQAIRDRLATATTPKDVQDAQAQIELETTWTTNENAQLVALKATSDMQTDSRQQQASEEATNSLDNQIAQARAAGIIQ
jgi:type IV secretion system protein VirB5